MAYNDIVNVAITLNATALTQAGFGTIGFLAETRVFSERVRAYTATSDMLTDGFVATDSAYRAALSAFGESPQITSFKVIRRNASWSGIPQDISTKDYTLNIGFADGTTEAVTYTATGSPTAQSISDGLVTEIANHPLVVAQLDAETVGVSADAYLSLSPKSTSSFFNVTVLADEFLGTFGSTETPADTIASADEEDSDYYFVAAEYIDDANILDTSVVVESQDRLYFCATNEVANIGAVVDPDTSLFGQLRAANRQNTVGVFHQEAGNTYPECAYIASNSVYDAGSVTWCNVQPSIAASAHPQLLRRLTVNEKSNLNLRSANYADYDAGVTFMRTGKVFSNNFIDEIRGVHWLTAQLQTNLTSLLVNQSGGKVPYTNVGRAMVRGAIENALQQAVNRDFLDSFTITIPELNTIPNNDRIARILQGVTFNGLLVGAIHDINITGTVSPVQS